MQPSPLAKPGWAADALAREKAPSTELSLGGRRESGPAPQGLSAWERVRNVCWPDSDLAELHTLRKKLSGLKPRGGSIA